MFKELSTQRLLLRKIQQTDADFILQGLSNTLVTKYMLIRYYTLQEVQEQMDYYANHYTNNTGMYWLMQSTTSNQSMGVIGLNNLSIVHKKAELGFWLLPQFWNKGFTTEASKAMLNFCFNNLQLNRIEATVETENIASIDTIQKLGFTQEGTFKEYEINNGKFINLMMFALLKSEFSNLY
jgi:[ribosomal protein S5]-alanine N-acetyltransferase